MMMEEDLIDTRPEYEPEFYAYRELPDDPDERRDMFIEMAALQRMHGADFFRYTIASPEYPKPPYPDGLYVEGWKTPEGPWKQAPFNFPLTAGGG
jgi:hypothetical protein